MLKIPLLPPPALPFPTIDPKRWKKKESKKLAKRERGRRGLWRSKNDEEFVDQKTKENC
jgi:hypothetical protein